jgi:hypothetical protein
MARVLTFLQNAPAAGTNPEKSTRTSPPPASARNAKTACAGCEFPRSIYVICYAPMASGLLTGAMTRERAAALPTDDFRSRNPEFREPRLSKNLELIEHLRKVAERHGVLPGAVAIA